MKDRAIGVREVAAAAGVSRQTVSRVVNNHHSIRPETRARVLQVIDELGYRPNRAALLLGTNRSGVIGVISAVGAAEYGPDAAIQSISQAATQAGYHVNVIYVNPPTATALEEALQAQLDVMAEGLILIAPQNRTISVIDHLGIDIPSVFFNAASKQHGHHLRIDQEFGARLATRHLLELGHRVIAHVAGPQEWLEADARMRGYLEEMMAWDVEPLAPILGDWTAETGYRAGRLLARRPGLTAVFTGNDSAALGVLHALHEDGVRVPEQMSVVGFDDVPMAAHTWPPLTTVRQDFAELGRRCVAALLDQLPDDVTVLKPVLVVRSSTAALPN